MKIIKVQTGGARAWPLEGFEQNELFTVRITHRCPARGPSLLQQVERWILRRSREAREPRDIKLT
jgi:hypothetical protein